MKKDEQMILMLISMCRAAAEEIKVHWDAHCGSDGYGPCNLVARLEGKLPPDVYPAYLDDDDKAVFADDYGNI